MWPMAYQSGAAVVGTAAGIICAVPLDGEVLLQNQGTVAVTLGGPGVVAGQGPSLPANMTTPLVVPTGIVHGQADNDDRLYGRTASGSASVGFMVAG